MSRIQQAVSKALRFHATFFFGHRQQGRLDYNMDGLTPELLGLAGEDLALPGMRIIVYGAEHEYRKRLHPTPNRNFDDIGSFIFVVLQNQPVSTSGDLLSHLPELGICSSISFA